MYFTISLCQQKEIIMTTTTTKKAEELQIGDVLVISNKPIKVVGKWGLAVSLDMYVSDEVRATSYTTNRKLNLKAGQEFKVLNNDDAKKSLFEITHLLKSN